MSKLDDYRLSDLYEMSSGISTKPEQAGKGAPFLSFGTIYSNYILPDVLDDKMDTTPAEQEKYSVRYGDVFLTRTSETIDELAMSSVALKDYPSATFSGFAKRLRPLDNSFPNPAFMAFYLRSPHFRKVIECMTTMTTRASFNEDLFGFLNVTLPSVDEQSSIGELLVSIEKKQTANKQINDNLLAALQTLYGYWFIQFEFPNSEGKPYKSSGGSMVYNDTMGRWIPAGWSVASIIDNPLCEVIAPGVSQFKTKTYYATADVVGMNIGTGSTVEYATRESRANMQPELHSVWFAKMKDSVKHLFLSGSMQQMTDESILSTGFMGLRCSEEAFEYIAAFIAGPYFEMAKNQYANGATQQAVGNAELESVNLVIPDVTTLRRFHTATTDLLECVGSNIIENRKITALRDWLLPMLMNGQATITQP